MATIQRLTDSCVLVTSDDHATLFDPGFHTFDHYEGLESIGEVTRVMVTHEHRDHVNPDFLAWLVDRRSDLVIYANDAVASLLSKEDLEVVTDSPTGVTIEDVRHGRLPTGAQPPNRSFTIDGLFTHPGDSREPTRSAPVLALPLIVPWSSATAAVEFAQRLKPEQVIPIHDYYMNEMGRAWIRGFIGGIVADMGIEMVELDWGERFTV